MVCLLLLLLSAHRGFRPIFRLDLSSYFYHTCLRIALQQEQSTRYSDANGKPGKQWHDTKKAFRPTAGQTAYAKRAAKDKELAVVKAQEKEMKDEKEAERQVSSDNSFFLFKTTDTKTETDSSPQGEARGKGREGTFRQDGCQDAPKESGQTEAQRKEEQDAQVVR